MTDIDRFYIAGAWRAPHSLLVLPIINPATEQAIGRVVLATPSMWTLLWPPRELRSKVMPR